MEMDMTDIEKALEDPGYREYLEQCLNANTVIEYKCGPGADGYIHIEGIMPTLFNGACAILKEVAIRERPERRKGLLDLVHGQILEELAEGGYL